MGKAQSFLRYSNEGAAMTPTNIKLGIGVMLFATWVSLVVCKISGAEDIISAIKLALIGLGAYHIDDRKQP